MSLRILLVGSDKPGSLENFYLKHLSKHKDVEIKFFPAHSYFFDYYHKSLTNKILFRLGWDFIYQRINRYLINEVENFQPDVLLVFKGMEIYPSTLEKLKKAKVKLVNYNPDHPYLFFGSGTGNLNVKNGVSKYDLYLTYSDKIREEIEKKYKIESVVLPFGYEFINEQLIDEENEILKICFVGNPDKFRKDIIYSLVKNGLHVDVYGYKWDKWFRMNEGVGVYNSIFQEDFLKTASKYRMNLNLFRPHNFDSHNMRSFEIPASGSIMLAPFSMQQQKFFDDQNEVFYFSSDAELYKKAKLILDLPFNEADKIKQNALKKSKEGKYGYLNRSQQLLSLLKNL